MNRCLKTSTGIRIGCAHIPPKVFHDRSAVLVQKAILYYRPPSIFEKAAILFVRYIWKII